MPTKKKDTKNEDINKLFAQELGLDILPDGKMYDQDTCSVVNLIEGKQNIYRLPDSEVNKSKKVIQFDPAKNSRHAKMLFDYFNEKLESEDIKESYSTYNSYVTDNNTNKGILECKTFDTNEVTRSNEYVNESLRYLDIIMQINGSDTSELESLDRTKEEFDKIRATEERARKAEEKKRLENRKPKYEPGSEEQRQAQIRMIRSKYGKK